MKVQHHPKRELGNACVMRIPIRKGLTNLAPCAVRHCAECLPGAALAGDRLGGDEDFGTAQQRSAGGVGRVQLRPVEAAYRRELSSEQGPTLPGRRLNRYARRYVAAEAQKDALPGGLSQATQTQAERLNACLGRWLDVGSCGQDGGGGGFLELRQVRERHPGAQLRQEEPHLALSPWAGATVSSTGPVA